jgi:hypothetical protein
MHERILRDYFAGAATATDLARDILAQPAQRSGDVVRQRIVDMGEEFRVTVKHAVQLCDAVLAGELEPWMLEPIAFCLIASDHFDWDAESPESERMADTLYDWSAPEINYRLTKATVEKFRLLLVTGENTFTRADLTPANQPLHRTSR